MNFICSFFFLGGGIRTLEANIKTLYFSEVFLTKVADLYRRTVVMQAR